MTRATDELRQMLNEADEYYKTSWNKTWWGRPIDMQTGKPINVFHYQAQPMGEDRLFVELQLATPAQAIAATLGDADATATRQGDAGTCHEVADNLRLWHPHETFDNDHMGEKHIRILYQLLGLGGALMMDGADAAEAVRDRLIQLLGGEDE